MFTVKWIMHRHESQPVEVETSCHGDLDTVVSSCQKRLSKIREKHSANPPDGFLVFNSEGKEVRRWFGSERSHA